MGPENLDDYLKYSIVYDWAKEIGHSDLYSFVYAKWNCNSVDKDEYAESIAREESYKALKNSKASYGAIYNEAYVDALYRSNKVIYCKIYAESILEMLTDEDGEIEVGYAEYVASQFESKYASMDEYGSYEQYSLDFFGDIQYSNSRELYVRLFFDKKMELLEKDMDYNQALVYAEKYADLCTYEALNKGQFPNAKQILVIDIEAFIYTTFLGHNDYKRIKNIEH